MTNTSIVRLDPSTPLPCSIQAPDGGICGRPATAAYARQLAPSSAWAVPGLWELQPVCRDCAAAAAAAIPQEGATQPAVTATHRRRSKWDRFQEETTP
jgi:hypothetical protein